MAKEINSFFSPIQGNGNVVFNFQRDPVDDLTAFATGYHRAAQTLVKRFRTGAYADYDGYPVLYLYRHALELYLKATVYKGARLMRLIGENDPHVPALFRQHKLTTFLPAIRAIFKTMQWTFEGTEFSSFDGFKRVIGDLDEIDSGSYAFRYPINPEGQAHLPHHFMVNLPKFAETLDALLVCLEGATIGLEETFQSEAEARYEVQQLLDEWHE